MEEILASIRRIIEDSDVERKREPDGAPAAMAPAANDVSDSGKGVEAFRAEFVDAPEPEIAAPVLAAEGIEAELPSGVAAAESLQQPSGSSSPEFLEEVPSAEASASDIDDIDFPEHAFDDLEASAGDTDLQPRNQGPSAQAESRPRLISEQTGRQVASSFGELSEAFAASRRRSFDEMAEEMLRPMLQDWLDNNLPHLVERLVREEIERIARG